MGSGTPSESLRLSVIISIGPSATFIFILTGSWSLGDVEHRDKNH